MHTKLIHSDNTELPIDVNTDFTGLDLLDPIPANPYAARIGANFAQPSRRATPVPRAPRHAAPAWPALHTR